MVSAHGEKSRKGLRTGMDNTYLTLAQNMLSEINKVIVGKSDVVRKVLMAILAGGHILIEDIPGMGKTTMALAFSKCMGLRFNRIQFNPDVTSSDVIGFSIYIKEKNAFEYKPGAVLCNLLLADEINRTSSRTQAALLEVMEEKNVTVDGKTYRLPEPFLVIGTQNPAGSYGTQMLPQSQLDRFMIKLEMGYPDVDSQVEILKDRQIAQPLDQVQKIMNAKQMLELQKAVAHVHMNQELLRYIAELADYTRRHQALISGISPRGALALSRMTKAQAFLSGRDFAVTQDVTAVLLDVCGHRMLLSPEAKVKGTSETAILQEAISEVKAPEMIIKEKTLSKEESK